MSQHVLQEFLIYHQEKVLEMEKRSHQWIELIALIEMDILFNIFGLRNKKLSRKQNLPCKVGPTCQEQFHAGRLDAGTWRNLQQANKRARQGPTVPHAQMRSRALHRFKRPGEPGLATWADGGLPRGRRAAATGSR